MQSLFSFVTAVWPSELPPLLLLGMLIVAHHKTACSRSLVLVYGLAMLQVALPVLMLTSALLLGPDQGVSDVIRSTASLTYMPIGLYLLQIPVGILIGFFIARSRRIENPVKITVGVVAIQMAFSFPLLLMTAMLITGSYV